MSIEDEHNHRLTTVTIEVCGLCLDGSGGECHTKGCAFWWDQAPSPAQAVALRKGAVGTDTDTPKEQS